MGIEQLAFASYLYPDDYDMVIDKWQSMIGGTPTTFEMRWKAPLNEYGEDFAYTLAACMPVSESSRSGRPTLTVILRSRIHTAKQQASTDA